MPDGGSGALPPWVMALTAKVPLQARVRALFGGAPAANALFMLAISIGFFHGWIKYKYTGLISTFAFDAPLTLALVLALTQAGHSGSWFPTGNRIGEGLKVLAVVALFYVVLPFGVPLLASVAAFRAWVVIPLVFLLGYHVTRSIRQVETLLLLVIGLCCVTVYFGARQTPEEIRAMLAANPDLARRLSGTFFANDDGSGGLRAFSTFVSAGAFGGTLSTGGICAFAYLTRPGQKFLVRLAFAVALGLCAYGINLSGARTAVAMLVLGILFTAWSRKRLLAFVVIPGAALSVAGLGSLMDPARLARFSSLFDPAQLWGRLAIVVGPGVQEIFSAPLGGGLGRSGHGVPYVFGSILPPWDVKPVDGDLGRIAVEFGLPGILMFGVLLWSGISASLRWMVQFRDTSLQTLAICSGSVFMIASINIGTGSPFLGVPGGALTWFLLGAMNRLAVLVASYSPGQSTAWKSDPRFAEFGAAVASNPDPAPQGQPVEPAAVGAMLASHRRMLYRQEPEHQSVESREADVRKGRVRRLYGDSGS